MDERRYKLLMRLAVLLTLAWVGWTLYDSGPRMTAPGAHQLSAGLRYLEDEMYQDALDAFNSALAIDGDNLGALRGKAQAHMQIGAHRQYEAETLAQQGNTVAAERAAADARQSFSAALAAYDRSIEREQARGLSDRNRRILGIAYANRGILKDRMADYPGALADYRNALRLEPEVKDGPGLLTRFLRNQSQKPPSVADRARYLEQQLAKPEPDRLLRRPDEDIKQRPYRID